MFGDIFTHFVFNPLYNALILLIDFGPYADVGIAVILLTIAVKVLLFPLAHKVAHMQVRMRALTPELKALQERHKSDPHERALKMMALYKKHKIRPFLSFLVILIQLPIIFGLYWVFFRGGLPVINTEILYSFVPVPTIIQMEFLGLIDMSGRSALLAFLAGVTQYIHTTYVLPTPEPKSAEPTLKEDLAHSFHIQMKYILPIIMMAFAYFVSAAIALYLLTSNLFAIAQERIVRRQLRAQEPSPPETP